MRESRAAYYGHLLLCGLAASAADWPQLQGNAARTGWTPDSPAPPFEIAYRLTFDPEPLGLVQPILYKDAMYVPTKWGRLYALDPATGARLWAAENLGAILCTAAAADGLVYTANLDGQLAATHAEGGAETWRADLGGAISATPCAHRARVYVGTRRGDFCCVNGQTGAIAWRRPLGHFVWAGAAADADRVYIVTDGDIHVFCLDADTGEVLWRSPKLPGVFARDFCPVVTAGRVFVRVLPADCIADASLVKPYSLWERDRAVFLRYYDELREGKLPEDFKAANRAMVATRAEMPWRRTLFAFDAATGAEPYICGEYHALAGWLMPCPPGAIDSTGMMQAAVPFPWPRLGQIDPETGQIARIPVGPLLEPQGNAVVPDGLGGNNDESHASSSGGDRVYWVHFSLGANSMCVFDVKTREMWTHARAGLTIPHHLRDKGLVPVSLSAGQRAEPALSDNTQHDAYAAAVPWKNMLFHMGRQSLTALREKR